MSYLHEFGPGVTVPAFLLADPWVDCSWHNDVCPSFHDLARRLAVWVAFDEATERECGGPKFLVVTLTAEGDYTDEAPLLETEDVDELRSFLETRKAPVIHYAFRFKRSEDPASVDHEYELLASGAPTGWYVQASIYGLYFLVGFHDEKAGTITHHGEHQTLEAAKAEALEKARKAGEVRP